MVEWKFNDEDRNITFLIKTMKKKYLEKTLKQGEFCFNLPSVFNLETNLAVAQQDKWDSHLSYIAQKIYYAPIISEDENGVHYGVAKKLADSARMYQISEASKHTPLCCFRKVDDDDLVEKYGAAFLRLGNIVDRIKNEMGHDAFILIIQPHALVHRIHKVSPCFARSVHYGEINSEFQEYLDTYDFDQKEMFQKRIEYAWQKEFRIIIAPTNKTSPQMIHIGSIEDIAFGGDIETLRQGYVFAENDEQLQMAIKRATEEGGIYN